MALRIRTQDLPYYSERVRLDGKDFILRFRYVQREDRWYLSIADSNDQPLVTERKIVANWPLLAACRARSGLPAGDLIATDASGNGSSPGLGELGESKRVQLLYFTADELTEAFG